MSELTFLTVALLALTMFLFLPLHRWARGSLIHRFQKNAFIIFVVVFVTCDLIYKLWEAL